MFTSIQLIFICKGVTLKIVSRGLTETQDPTPQRAAVALKPVPLTGRNLEQVQGGVSWSEEEEKGGGWMEERIDEQHANV